MWFRGKCKKNNGNARKTMVAKTKTAPRGMSIGSFGSRKFEKN